MSTRRRALHAHLLGAGHVAGLDIDWAAVRARSYDVRPARGTIVRTTHDVFNGVPLPAGTSIRVVTIDNAGFRGIELHGVAVDGPRAGDYIVGLSTGLVEVVS